MASVIDLSVNRLSEVTGLDRRTVTSRLKALPPDPDVYDLIGVLFTVSESEKARLEKTATETAIKKLQLQEEQGLLVRRRSITEELVRIFKALHNLTTIIFPRRVAEKLANKSEPEIRTILQAELGKIFDGIRADYRNLFTGLDDSGTTVKPKSEPMGRKLRGTQQRKLSGTRKVKSKPDALSQGVP